MKEDPKTQSLAQGYSITVEHNYDFSNKKYVEFFEKQGTCAFQHPIWLKNFYNIIAVNRGGEAIILKIDDSEGELACIIPLIFRSRFGIRMLEAAELGVTDYCTPIIGPQLLSEPIFLKTIAKLLPSLLPSFDILRINKARKENAYIWESLFGATTKQHDFSAHATELGNDYKAWSETAISSSMRKSLRRKRNKFEREKNAIFEEVQFQDIEEAIAGLRSFREGRFEGDLIQSDFVFNFYRQVALEGFASGYAKIYRLKIGDTILGYTFGITHNGNFNYLLIGCDYDNFGNLSPGYLLYDYMIESWIDKGGKVFDFTIGDEKFKGNFGTEPTSMYYIEECKNLRGRLGLGALKGLASIRT